MALQTKLSLVSLDKTAHNLIVKDSTGVYSVGNPTGYGSPNPVDVARAFLTVRHFGSTTSKSIELPNIDELLNGVNIPIDSGRLGITQAGQGIEAFSDGILDLDYTVVLNNPIQVQGTAGNSYIVGTGLDALLSYEQISIAGELYTINKFIPTNNGTVLYLNSPLTFGTGTVVVLPVEVANLKVLVQAEATRLLVSNTGVMANNCCDCYNARKFLEDISKLYVWKIAAQLAFDQADYQKADNLIHTVNDFGPLKPCQC
jgi:hypothetical protein